MLSQWDTILTVAERAAASFTDLVFAFSFLLSLSDSMSSSSSDSSVVFYASFLWIISYKILKIASDSVSLLVNTVSVRNGRGGGCSCMSSHNFFLFCQVASGGAEE